MTMTTECYAIYMVGGSHRSCPLRAMSFSLV